ncbi:hypothetical protein N5C46_22905 [Rossellomorea vietnamensis]|uniref:Uncharacterized protein n=1 Tax=Rossellomorea vietnamensis TaxID=218284 RepID=A0ACD4C6Y7_9BACI|nr:hypothetical protein [Rossellomorea vietnamensis]UXH44430.1 hypothetical protein N5C46_22905 [Rossellomorea vietnamensis]
MTFIKDKINVFISSKCGVESYDIIRAALKNLLENTGFITTYVFEAGDAASVTARDEYLNKLEDCHVVLFLIDNKEPKIPEGVMKEWMHARKIGRKAIYLFLNDPLKKESEIQKELNGPNGARYKVVNNIQELIDTGFKSVMNDIVNIYNEYCKNRLIKLEEQGTLDENGQEYINNITPVEKSLIKKKELTGFSKTTQLFKNIIFKKNEQIEPDNEMDEFSYYLTKYLIGEGEISKINFSLIMTIINNKYEGNLKEVINKRWQAIEWYYKGDMEKAISQLSEAVSQIEELKIEKWIRDDILIDIRNFENKKMNNSNQVFISDAQKKIEDNSHLLYFPAIDRVQKNINNEILKDINKFTIQSPYSTSIGSKIEYLLEDVAKSLYIAIIYGSLTHISLTNSLLKDIFQHYSRIYDEYQLKFEYLRFSILDQDYKNIKHICNNNSEILSSCSFEKIYELYRLSNSIPYEGDRTKTKLVLFNHLGYYFGDKDYDNIQDEIFIILNKWLYSEPIVGNWSFIFQALKGNIRRIDINKVLPFLIQIIKNKFFRFYDNVFDLLKSIDWKVNAHHIRELKKLILDLLKEDQLKDSRFFQSLIISLRRQFVEFSEFDKTIEEEWEKFHNLYKLEVFDLSLEENSNYIKKYVEEMVNRNKTLGKNGVYGTFATSPYRIIKNIISYSNLVLPQPLFTKVIKSIKDTLLNPKQYANEKLDGLELLFALKLMNNREDKIEFDWEALNIEIQSNVKNVLNIYQGIFEKDSELTVRLYLYIWFIANSVSEDKELLLLLSVFNKEDVYQNIKLLESLKLFISYHVESKKEIPNAQIILHVILSKSRDRDFYLRYHAIESLFLMIGKGYDDLIVSELSELIEDPDYRIKAMIINNANKLNSKYKGSMEIIFEKAKIDNNYIIRRNELTLN